MASFYCTNCGERMSNYSDDNEFEHFLIKQNVDNLEQEEYDRIVKETNEDYRKQQKDPEFGKHYREVDTWFDVCFELGNDTWICPKCKTMHIFKRGGVELEQVYAPVAKSERFKTVSAAIVALVDDGKVLLQKRKNTGFADGMWDLSASGHVERGETMKEAAIRETKEEIGVEIEKIEFCGLMHNLGEDGTPRYLGVFKALKFNGEPKICEPDKCDELEWFDLDNLPEKIIESRRGALEDMVGGSASYLEFGWDR